MAKSLFILFIVCVLLVIPLVSAGTMSRSLTSSTVAAGSTFTVIYTSQTTSPLYWTVDEGLPVGVSAGSQICQDNWGSDNYQLKCRVRFEGSLPYTLTLTAPTTVGTYVFSEGKYALWIDKNDMLTTMQSFPSMTLTVTAAACVPSWSCGNWGTCSGNPGTQTRTCTDSKNCNIACAVPDTCGTSRACCTAPVTCTVGTCAGHKACTGGVLSDTCVKDVATCGGSCTEDWKCTTWGTCSESKTHTRSCTDANSCGTIAKKPAESESCGGIIDWVKQTFGITDDIVAYAVLIFGGFFGFMFLMMILQMMMGMTRGR